MSRSQSAGRGGSKGSGISFDEGDLDVDTPYADSKRMSADPQSPKRPTMKRGWSMNPATFFSSSAKQQDRQRQAQQGSKDKARQAQAHQMGRTFTGSQPARSFRPESPAGGLRSASPSGQGPRAAAMTPGAIPGPQRDSFSMSQNLAGDSYRRRGSASTDVSVDTSEMAKSMERLQNEVKSLQDEFNKLRNEHKILRSELRQARETSLSGPSLPIDSIGMAKSQSSSKAAGKSRDRASSSSQGLPVETQATSARGEQATQQSAPFAPQPRQSVTLPPAPPQQAGEQDLMSGFWEACGFPTTKKAIADGAQRQGSGAGAATQSSGSSTAPAAGNAPQSTQPAAKESDRTSASASAATTQKLSPHNREGPMEKSGAATPTGETSPKLAQFGVTHSEHSPKDNALRPLPNFGGTEEAARSPSNEAGAARSSSEFHLPSPSSSLGANPSSTMATVPFEGTDLIIGSSLASSSSTTKRSHWKSPPAGKEFQKSDLPFPELDDDEHELGSAASSSPETSGSFQFPKSERSPSPVPPIKNMPPNGRDAERASPASHSGAHAVK